jgi:multimeric flavodoxin WrbA
MKIFALNGSCRSEHTSGALKNVLLDRYKDDEIEFVGVNGLSIAGCRTCEYCHEHDGKCIIEDDVEMLLKKMIDADMIVIGSPVYYWMLSAQVTAVIDRMYAVESKLRDKKFAYILTGSSPEDDEQWDALKYQLRSIAKYFNWSLEFEKIVTN